MFKVIIVWQKGSSRVVIMFAVSQQSNNNTRVIGYGVICYYYSLYRYHLYYYYSSSSSSHLCIFLSFRSNLRLPALPHPIFFLVTSSRLHQILFQKTVAPIGTCLLKNCEMAQVQIYFMISAGCIHSDRI